LRMAFSASVLYTLILVFASIMPNLPPVGAMGSDKAAHLIAYGLHAALLFFTFFCAARSAERAAMLAVIGSLTLGFVTEVLQLLVPYRSFELLDLAADGAGVLLAVAVCWVGARRFERRGVVPTTSSHGA